VATDLADIAEDRVSKRSARGGTAAAAGVNDPRRHSGMRLMRALPGLAGLKSPAGTLKTLVKK